MLAYVSRFGVLVLTWLLLAPLPAAAQLEHVTAPGGTVSDPLPNALVSIVNIFLTLVGIIAGIILIYAGVQYVISRGDDQAVAKAKSIILYAIVGLIVIGLAAAIVNFTIGAFGGGR